MSVQQYYTTKAGLTSKEKQDTKLISRALLERFGGNPYYARARVVAGKVSYKPEREPLNEELLTLHLKGERTLGAYQLDKNNCVKFIAWDIDSDNPVIAKIVTKKIIEKLGDIPHCIELSGRKGYHVFIFLASPMPASKAKQIAEAVRGDLPIAGAVHVEVFPKQVELTKENPMGSLIKIPLCLHPLTKERSRFIDPLQGWEDGEAVDPLTCLNKIVDPATLEVLLTLPRPKPAAENSSYTQLGQPLEAGNRNESIYHHARVMARNGAEYEFVLSVMLQWAAGQKDLPESEIERTVRSAFKDIPSSGLQNVEILDASFFLGPHEEIPMIVGDLIGEGYLGILYGKFGSKKTWILYNLGACVAIGKSWLGMPTKQKNVLIVDEESGKPRLALRMGRVMRGIGADPTAPIIATSLAGFNFFKNPEAGEVLRSLIREKNIGLCLIDALVEVMSGGDENSVNVVADVLQTLRKISLEEKCAILIIHHPSKPNVDLRGSSAIAPKLDLLIKVESAIGCNTLTFKIEKARDSESLSSGFSSTAIWDKEHDLFYIEPAVSLGRKGIGVNLPPSQDHIRRFLQEHGDSDGTSIINSGDIMFKPGGLKTALNKLIKLGMVRRTNPGGPARNGALYEWVEDEK